MILHPSQIWAMHADMVFTVSTYRLNFFSLGNNLIIHGSKATTSGVVRHSRGKYRGVFKCTLDARLTLYSPSQKLVSIDQHTSDREFNDQRSVFFSVYN